MFILMSVECLLLSYCFYGNHWCVLYLCMGPMLIMCGLRHIIKCSLSFTPWLPVSFSLWCLSESFFIYLFLKFNAFHLAFKRTNDTSHMTPSPHLPPSLFFSYFLFYFSQGDAFNVFFYIQMVQLINSFPLGLVIFMPYAFCCLKDTKSFPCCLVGNLLLFTVTIKLTSLLELMNIVAS